MRAFIASIDFSSFVQWCAAEAVDLRDLRQSGFVGSEVQGVELYPSRKLGAGAAVLGEDGKMPEWMGAQGGEPTDVISNGLAVVATRFPADSAIRSYFELIAEGYGQEKPSVQQDPPAETLQAHADASLAPTELPAAASTGAETGPEGPCRGCDPGEQGEQGPQGGDADVADAPAEEAPVGSGADE